jgi:NADH dehydrogenase [ubiquinone] 1 alpha subcomplex assembly factor 5
VDTDVIKINYADPFVLMKDLKGMGENNAVKKRRSWVNRKTIMAAASIYKSMYGNPDGSIPATFQVITICLDIFC